MIFAQPNGLHGRVSSVIEAPTHVDMSESDLYEYLMDTMQLDYFGQTAKEWLERYEGQLQDAIDMVSEINMTKEEIKEWKIEISN